MPCRSTAAACSLVTPSGTGIAAPTGTATRSAYDAGAATQPTRSPSENSPAPRSTTPAPSAPTISGTFAFPYAAPRPSRS